MIVNYDSGILCDLKGGKWVIPKKDDKMKQDYSEFKETYIFNNYLAANEKFERLF